MLNLNQINKIKKKYLFYILLLLVIIILLFNFNFFKISNENINYVNIENFANSNFDKIFTQCYDYNRKKIPNEYYYSEKNQTVTTECDTNCDNPTYKDIMGKTKLYLVGSGRNNNKCLDKYPIIYLRLNKVLLNGEFIDISGYPNNVITNMNCMRQVQGSNKRIYTCVKRNLNDNLFYSYSVFNGLSDYITVEGEHLNNLDKNISISAWICPLSKDKLMTLYKKGEKGWSISIDSDNKLLIKVGSKFIKSNSVIAHQKWSYIAITINQVGNNILGKMYIDAVENGNIEFQETHLPTGQQGIAETGKLVIGADGLDNEKSVISENMYHGRMRNFRLYNFFMRKIDIEKEFSSSMLLSKIKLNKENNEEIEDKISYIFKPNHLYGTTFDNGNKLFDGSNDYLKLESNKIPHRNNSWGIIFSVKNKRIRNGTVMHFSKPPINMVKAGKEIRLFIHGNKYRLSLGDENMGETIEISNITPDLNWHVFGITFNSVGNEITLFYDGELALTKKILLNLEKPLIYFGNKIGGNNYWNGYLREILIYKTALSRDNIHKQNKRLIEDALGISSSTDTDLEDSENTDYDFEIAINQGLRDSQELSVPSSSYNMEGSEIGETSPVSSTNFRISDNEIKERLKKVCEKYISLPGGNENDYNMEKCLNDSLTNGEVDIFTKIMLADDTTYNCILNVKSKEEGRKCIEKKLEQINLLDTIQLNVEKRKLSDYIKEIREKQIKLRERTNTLLKRIEEEVSRLEAFQEMPILGPLEQERVDKLIKAQNNLIEELKQTLSENLSILGRMQDEESKKIQGLLVIEYKIQESRIDILKKRIELENNENKEQQEKILNEIKELEKQKEKYQQMSLNKGKQPDGNLTYDLNLSSSTITPFNQLFSSYGYDFNNQLDILGTNDLSKVNQKSNVEYDQSLPKDFLCQKTVQKVCPKTKELRDYNIEDHPDIKNYVPRHLKCPTEKIKCSSSEKECPVNYEHSPFCNRGVELRDLDKRTGYGSIIGKDFNFKFQK